MKYNNTVMHNYAELETFQVLDIVWSVVKECYGEPTRLFILQSGKGGAVILILTDLQNKFIFTCLFASTDTISAELASGLISLQCCAAWRISEENVPWDCRMSF